MCEHLVDEEGARRHIQALQGRNRELRNVVARLVADMDRVQADTEFAAGLLARGFGWDQECEDRLGGYLTPKSSR